MSGTLQQGSGSIYAPTRASTRPKNGAASSGVSFTTVPEPFLGGLGLRCADS